MMTITGRQVGTSARYLAVSRHTGNGAEAINVFDLVIGRETSVANVGLIEECWS